MRIHTIKQAFYKSIPVLAGYVVLGIGFRILMRSAGYGVVWAAVLIAAMAIMTILIRFLPFLVFRKQIPDPSLYFLR